MADNKNDKLIESLSKISGIGPSQAKDLIKKGVKSVSDLKKKKIYDGLKLESQYWLKYKPNRNISHSTISKLVSKIKTTIPGIDIQAVGSYRRGKATSKDVDLLIVEKGAKTLSYWNEFIEKLKKSNITVLPPYNTGKNVMRTLVKLPNDTKYMKVDFFRSNITEYPFMLLYTTGSREFNLRSRAKAKHEGWLLNQSGLFKIDKNGNASKICSKCKTEKDIFKKLEITWKEPKDR